MPIETIKIPTIKYTITSEFTGNVTFDYHTLGRKCSIGGGIIKYDNNKNKYYINLLGGKSEGLDIKDVNKKNITRVIFYMKIKSSIRPNFEVIHKIAGWCERLIKEHNKGVK